MLRVAVHFLGVLQFSFSVFYDWYFVVIPTTVMKSPTFFAGKFVYLTFWNAIIQSLFFGISLLNDFIGNTEFHPKTKPALAKFKDDFFCIIAFPLSAFVSISFWGLYAIDRELVFPKVLDSYFPTWLNHIMHTNILTFSLIELMTSFRQYPSRKKGLSLLTLFIVIYLIWILVVFFKSNMWVYPVLEVLTWPQKIIFFLALLFLIQGFYIFGEMFNKLVWRSEFQKIKNIDRRKSEKKKP